MTEFFAFRYGISQIFLYLGAATLVVGLYLTSLYNYLLFHSLVEIFSIVVALAAFTIIMNSWDYIDNPYLQVVGMAYFFVAGLDLLHTLSYKGMKIFNDYEFYANQLWIAARYLESLTLLGSFALVRRPIKMRFGVLFFFYAIVFSFLVLAIFYWKVFPVCFVEGTGLTSFKKNSEYVICTILAGSFLMLWRDRDRFDRKVFNYLQFSILFTILSELFFTIYISNYGISNLFGHYMKLASFYYIYKAIIETGIREPYNLIFLELKKKEKELELLATTDSLTGTVNRRAAFDLLEKMLPYLGRSQQNLILGYADINDLKQINDRFGHAAGDAAIKLFSQVLSLSLRESDYVCRLGGDEFLLILPQCDQVDADIIVQRIRERLQATPVPEMQGGTIKFSIGFSEFIPDLNEGYSSLDQLLAIADAEMYRNKSAGKRAAVSP